MRLVMVWSTLAAFWDRSLWSFSSLSREALDFWTESKAASLDLFASTKPPLRAP